MSDVRIFFIITSIIGIITGVCGIKVIPEMAKKKWHDVDKTIERRIINGARFFGLLAFLACIASIVLVIIGDKL